ncbi:hypothetical protein RP20_CCG004171 [Aedes albopictus]|nr:hypothetical protein RP20_CCG004171 [Aedes albopictus]
MDGNRLPGSTQPGTYKPSFGKTLPLPPPLYPPKRQFSPSPIYGVPHQPALSQHDLAISHDSISGNMKP